jgi:fluoride exporter
MEHETGALTEAAATPPAHPQDARKTSLEDVERRSGRQPGDESVLTEVGRAPPAPPEHRQGPSLEDVEQQLSKPSVGDELSRPPAVGASLPTPRSEQLEAKEKGLAKNRGTADYKPLRWATELYTVSWLVLFALLGTLARLGVEAITLYPNSPFPSRVLWANLGGSLFMGFLAEDRRLFQHEWGSPKMDAPPSNHLKVKKTIPLYIGLATGFCGSFTSFSSFIRDCFLALTNDLESPSLTSAYHVDARVPHRTGGFSFLALLAVVIVHPAISIAALQVGAQLALALQPWTPTLPFKLCRKVLDPAGVVLAWGCWFGAVLLAIWPPGNHIHWRTRAALPLVFAPLGCLLRFYASKHMNALVPTFPMGTFAVNIFGTAVLGMAFDLQHAAGIGATEANACAILQGVMEGFCGCLTTVSTWVVELTGLRRRHAWIYGFVSVGVGLALMVVIMGSMGWTVGFSAPACS